MASSKKVRVATIWLSGCAGCHMSFLDQDEALIDLAQQIDLVYSPIVDIKVFPEDVDVTLVEGAVANEDQEELIKFARDRTKILISLGDCADTANVTGLRNSLAPVSPEAVLKRAYIETADINPQIPTDVPTLLPKALPVHEVVKVDYFIPGCPPPAGLINWVIGRLMRGLPVNMEGRSKFG
ncbi:MAG TPA: oxidoreductase [Candidatus Nanoarchaeia archaeon]|nr:oxidoreductase [Candidatus Nanoarchaeia archaeon]